MKVQISSILIALMSFVFIGTASANGLEEDGAWKFEDPITKSYKLNARIVEEKIKADGFKPGNTTVTLNCESGATCGIGSTLTGDGDIIGKTCGDNSINCMMTDIAGDGNKVKTEQLASDSAQVGSSVGDSNKIKTGSDSNKIKTGGTGNLITN